MWGPAWGAGSNRARRQGRVGVGVGVGGRHQEKRVRQRQQAGVDGVVHDDEQPDDLLCVREKALQQKPADGLGWRVAYDGVSGSNCAGGGVCARASVGGDAAGRGPVRERVPPPLSPSEEDGVTRGHQLPAQPIRCTGHDGERTRAPPGRRRGSCARSRLGPGRAERAHAALVLEEARERLQQHLRREAWVLHRRRAARDERGVAVGPVEPERGELAHGVADAVLALLLLKLLQHVRSARRRLSRPHGRVGRRRRRVRRGFLQGPRRRPRSRRQQVSALVAHAAVGGVVGATYELLNHLQLRHDVAKLSSAHLLPQVQPARVQPARVRRAADDRERARAAVALAREMPAHDLVTERRVLEEARLQVR